MNVFAIFTGDELLSGGVLNTNLTYAGERLAQAGHRIVGAELIGDDVALLEATFRRHLQGKTCDLLLISGGLGSTFDDLTRDVAARVCQRPLEQNASLRMMLQQRWMEHHPDSVPPEFYFRQADVPSGARILHNSVGLAPGLYWEQEEVAIALLPGPPVEFQSVLGESLLPVLQEGDCICRSILLAGEPEVKVQQKLLPLLPEGVKLTLCASAAGSKIYFSGRDSNVLEQLAITIRQQFPDSALPEGMQTLPEAIVCRVRRRNWTLGTAESCTGGRMAALFTAIPGVSDLFMGGVVAYDNSVKMNLLHVPERVLQTQGAVSASCAEAMVRGAQSYLHCHCALAFTGIAGPGGGTAQKPVGLVYIGAATPEKTLVREFRFRGTRSMVQERAMMAGCRMLWELLGENEEN